jgi:diaminopimelate epimerase
MQATFYKYQGTGNDFIIFDNRKKTLEFTGKKVRELCHRRFGIGADGLMLLNPHSVYDFEMVYYNSDGRPSSMCGNGGRCLAKFASDMGIAKTNYTFLAVDGEHQALINSDGTVSLKMKEVDRVSELNGHFILNTGSPHYITITNDVMHLDVFKKGREIRYSKEFEDEGINVNFVEQLNNADEIIVRTYERGVEDETFSCGTGVTAAALVCFHNDNGFNHVDVRTKGGRLHVEFDKTENGFENIWLIGPAERVFEGVINL